VATEETVIHLIRHGEVFNPDGTFYGRLPGYGLSTNGRKMAETVARWLAGRRIVRVVSSPLERARETAERMASEFGLTVTPDERLIEFSTVFEGRAVAVPPLSIEGVRRLRHFLNPFRPSWGEPYREVAARMLAAIADVRADARGGEAVCVSHQLPIWVARRAAEKRPLWHRPWRRQCALASVTSLTYDADTLVSVAYADPVGRAAS
jgi:broad specificity phosphatase PhoE